jgi:hypothetical protein
MKKTIYLALIATTLFACSAPAENKSVNNGDEAVSADFKENSKVALTLFHGFENKDMTPFDKNIADTAKIIGAKYGQGILTKAENTANLVFQRQMI